MEQFDWKKTIKPNIIMLKLLGLWPKGDESYGCNIYSVYGIASVIFYQVGHTFFQMVNLFMILDDLKAVTGSVYVVLMCISIVLKSYGLMKNMPILKQLMITVNCDLFQPRNLQQIVLVQPNLRAWKAIARTFWFFATGYAIFGALFPILDKTFKDYRLPFLAWYPYNIRKSPQYELTYIYQVLAGNFLSMSNVNVNTLIAALNMYIASQFDILCDDLKNMNNKDPSMDANQKLRNCIRHHKEIFRFADTANQFYNWLLFVEFFVDGFSIGITMFQLTVVAPLSSEFWSFFFYANAISTQIFMYCWFGNEVEIKSRKLHYAAFEADWTDFPAEIKQDLVIFITRVQRSLQISAFDYENSLVLFCSTTSIGHSFFQTVNLFMILDDLQAVTASVYVVLMCISIILKTYGLMKNMAMLKQLMTTVNSDLFQPKSPEQRALIQPNLTAWKTIVRTFWFFATGYAIFGALFPILDKSVKQYRLPFLAWYPYNTHKSPQYEMTYVYQVLGVNFLSMSNVNINTLIAALNMYIACQFDILYDDLRNMNDKDPSVGASQKLRSCIHHHKEILRFADSANQFYNWLLFVEFFVDGFSIGITMFQLTLVAPLSSEFWSYFTYANAISTQIFMYCWFGNEVEIKQMERFDWKETIKPNIRMLKFLGLWPKGDDSYGWNIYTLYGVVSVIFYQVGHSFFQTVNLFLILDDLKAVTASVYVVLMCISIVLKTYGLMNNMEKLKQLMITVNSDLFQPKNAEQRALVQPNLTAWKTIVRTFWFFAVGYAIFGALFPILDKSVKEYRLPFLAWYPYNTKKSPQYEVTYVYQILAINFISMSNVNINTLIAALNMYIASQFDILCDDLKNISDKDPSVDVNQKVRSCIHHHKEILRFADSANQFYNWLLFVEFFVDGFSIGITMFQLTVVAPLSSEFWSFFSYANAISTQIFMYCWFGNEVELK
ncbi:7tm 6 domain containing protein, partial [Asbolus verrucosus]